MDAPWNQESLDYLNDYTPIKARPEECLELLWRAIYLLEDTYGSGIQQLTKDDLKFAMALLKEVADLTEEED